MRMLSPLSTEWSWPRRNLAPVMMADVFEDFDRIVDSFLKPTYANTVNFQPSCDVDETNEHYLISFDMPGLKKEDIKIEVQGNQLIIAGERQHKFKSEDERITLRHERLYGKFERVFTLPLTIHADNIEAQYENGVLNIALPKAEKAKGRTIQIQTGNESFLGKLLGSKKENTKELKDAHKVS